VNRSDARALIVSTLQGLNLFDHVLGYEPDSLATLAPAPRDRIATVCAKSLDFVDEARGLFNQPCELWVTIYLRRAAGSGAAIEDTLDDTTPRCMAALWVLPEVRELNPSTAGYPVLDAKAYRMERFWVRIDHSQST
jgi:hypothetical protein